MKKILALLLVAMMAFSLMASGTNETSSVASSVEEDVDVSYPVKNNGETLSIWCPIQAPAAKYITSYNEQEIYQEISKNTGIKANYSHPAVGQEKEQLGLLVASGDLPDIIQIRDLYSGGASAGVDDGVFLDLTDLIKTYAPDYYKLICKDEMTYKLATDNNGRIVSFHLLKSTAPEFQRLNMASPIMEKYNVTEMPTTIAEWEELFERMAADGLPGFAPDKNGQIPQFMWPYGITNDFFLSEDGKSIRWGAGTPEYKEYLEMMHSWYEKGYLYKDFMSNLTISQRRALYSNLQVGMLVDAVDLAKSQVASKGYTSMPANYPRLTEDQKLHFRTVYFETFPVVIPGQSMTTVVTTQCKNPELAVQYLNYFYTQEGADLANWGIKDKAYIVDENGNKHFTDYMLNNEKIALGDAQTLLKIHLTAKLAEPDVICNPNVISSPEALALRNMYSDDPNVDSEQVLPAFTLSAEASYDRAKIMRDITTYADEMTLKFITGATPLSEFDNYLAQLDAMGLQEAIEITEKEYQTFMNKPVPEEVGK